MKSFDEPIDVLAAKATELRAGRSRAADPRSGI